MMVLALIAAVAKNGVIGNEGGMPWHLPKDLRFFKATTGGKPVIMGRKTSQSIGKPLPGRANLVVSRDSEWLEGLPEGLEGFEDLGAAIKRGRAIAQAEEQSEVFVIGGGELYRSAMPLAHRLYITWVDQAPTGDTLFPEVDTAIWVETAREDEPAEGGTPSLSFVTYERKTATA